MDACAGSLAGFIEREISCYGGAVRKYIAYEGLGCREEAGPLKHLFDLMAESKADELCAVSDSETMVAVRHAYDDAFVAVWCGPEVNPTGIIRSLRIAFEKTMVHGVVEHTNYLSPGSVEHNLDVWERKIGLILGVRFSSRLLRRVMNERSPGKMTLKDLDDVRFEMSSSIAHCIDLEITL